MTTPHPYRCCEYVWRLAYLRSSSFEFDNMDYFHAVMSLKSPVIVWLSWAQINPSSRWVIPIQRTHWADRTTNGFYLQSNIISSSQNIESSPAFVLDERAKRLRV